MHFGVKLQNNLQKKRYKMLENVILQYIWSAHFNLQTSQMKNLSNIEREYILVKHLNFKLII